MDLEKKETNVSTNEACKASANSLGACFLERALHQGKTIEIPSLGIIIKQENQSWAGCTIEE